MVVMVLMAGGSLFCHPTMCDFLSGAVTKRRDQMMVVTELMAGGSLFCHPTMCDFLSGAVTKRRDQMMVVTELMAGGSLFDMLFGLAGGGAGPPGISAATAAAMAVPLPVTLSLPRAMAIAADMARALYYMHVRSPIVRGGGGGGGGWGAAGAVTTGSGRQGGDCQVAIFCCLHTDSGHQGGAVRSLFFAVSTQTADIREVVVGWQVAVLC